MSKDEKRATRDEQLELLVAYVDGELEGEELAGVEALLADSEEARAVVEELRGLAGVMGQWEIEEPSPELDRRIEAAAMAELQGGGRRTSWLRSAGLVAAAACAALIVFGYAQVSNRPGVAGETTDTTTARDETELRITTRPPEATITVDGRDLGRGEVVNGLDTDGDGRGGQDLGVGTWEATRRIENIDPGAYRVDLITGNSRNSQSGEGRGDYWNGRGDSGGEQGNAAPGTDPRSMVIRTARMQLLVDDLAATVQRVEQAVAARDAHVQRSDVERRHAVIIVRVRAAELDSLRDALRPLGEVIVDATRAQDVTGDVVDTESRLRSARVTEERLLALAAERTGTVQQVLSVERELMRVRGEIERLEGRRAALRDRVAMSTLTIEIDARPEEQATPSAATRLGHAAEAGVQNLIALIVSIGEAIAAHGLSFLLLTALGYALIRLAARWLRRRRGAGSPLPPERG